MPIIERDSPHDMILRAIELKEEIDWRQKKLSQILLDLVPAFGQNPVTFSTPSDDTEEPDRIWTAYVKFGSVVIVPVPIIRSRTIQWGLPSVASKEAFSDQDDIDSDIDDDAFESMNEQTHKR